MPRSHRLTAPAELRRVLQSGRRDRRNTLDILWAPNHLPHPRLGLVIPKRGHTAVARNRLRRRLKELWRKELRSQVPALDVVIRGRAESYRASFGELRADLEAWREGLA
ncbi:MAG TPA: ribonuclease P protein component [Gemmatimonadales bacterium]|nr:ribonuclease P protein component [Gemmatimonadales bacterium]